MVFEVDRLRFTVYGLWFMVYGLWFMGYGFWFTVNVAAAAVKDRNCRDLMRECR